MNIKGFKTGDIVKITFKTEFMHGPETETGRLHVEPSGECWLEGWPDESVDPDDIIEMTKVIE